MIKKIICIFLSIIICLAVLGAIFVYSVVHNNTSSVEKDIETIKNIVNVLENELEDFGVDKETIDNVIEKIEEFNKETKYVVTFGIQNDTNPILSTKLSLPVDEEFFNSIEIGDTIAQEELQKIEDFIHLDQNFGSWTIIVKNKIIRE